MLLVGFPRRVRAARRLLLLAFLAPALRLALLREALLRRPLLLLLDAPFDPLRVTLPPKRRLLSRTRGPRYGVRSFFAALREYCVNTESRNRQLR